MTFNFITKLPIKHFHAKNVDVGINGRNSDGGIWANCPLKHALESNTVNLPEPTPLPHREADLPKERLTYPFLHW